MATPLRLTGKKLPYLKISKIGAFSTGVSAIHVHQQEASAINLVEAENAPEAYSYQDFYEGYAPLGVEVTAAWTGNSDGLYMTLWEDSGMEGIDFVFAPYGNVTPSTDKPHLTGKLSFPVKAGFEIPADAAPAEFTVVLDFEGTPTWVKS